jgi:hypothetical protein
MIIRTTIVKQDLNWIPSNVHALQWYDIWGEVEYNDEAPNERMKIGIFEQAVQTLIEKESFKMNLMQLKQQETLGELRVLRDQRI